MKKLILIVITTLTMTLATFAQNSAATPPEPAETKAKTPIFRANKDQITEAQKRLKVAETGRMDDAFRDALKKYQSENGLKPTGTLNRATLEKMGIALTDKQKAIPVASDSYADAKADGAAKKRGPVFRATKEQIAEAQKMLKSKGMYSGEASGKLDDATRAGLKSFQEASGMKPTGTLNQATLEKMGIALTEKQKENAAESSQ